jgi:murein DD-endopeptidase MepM/ murein hydrolase activator NlpD
LVYQEDAGRALRIVRDTGGRLSAKATVSEAEVHVAMTTVSIRDSLFSAGQTAGLSDKLIMRLVEMFRWDIDFALDIRDGDRFAVLYEEVFRNGVKVMDGEILAAEFINQGRRYRAVRFVNPQGRADYYTEDGKALRKAFLRTPVEFTRISSHFNLRRRHPVLHTIRAHRGVDYVAPQGTPVRATADGRVRFMGTKGGYGNTVVLDYSGNYSTLYAHLSRFVPKLRTGQGVRQGQVIGYVGSTGLATGPHLHYEFLVNGVHHDPLTVKLPGALPLPPPQVAVFEAQARKRFAKLDALTLSHAGMSTRPPPRDS